MEINELSGDQRRVQIDVVNLFKTAAEVAHELRAYRGGFRWKRTGDKEYLFRVKGNRGNGKGFGVRSEETERIYESFYANKRELELRYESLTDSLSKQSKIAVAHEIGRVPNIAADILRALDRHNLLGKGVSVVGTHALYAYEAAAGVMLGSDLMQTMDVDLLFDGRRKIKLHGDLDSDSLIKIIQSVDKSFKITARGSYRAVNDKGYMVELVKPISNPPMSKEKNSIGSELDLIASEVAGFNWMINAPAIERYAIAENGVPVKVIAPDPRVFSVMKLWLSRLKDRDPLKRPRDLAQSEAAAIIASNYLDLKFDDSLFKMLPTEIRRLVDEVKSFAEAHLDEQKSYVRNSFKI